MNSINIESLGVTYRSSPGVDHGVDEVVQAVLEHWGSRERHVHDAVVCSVHLRPKWKFVKFTNNFSRSECFQRNVFTKTENVIQIIKGQHTDVHKAENRSPSFLQLG